MAQPQVSIEGEQSWINGEPTYPGRVHRGKSIEGLLVNSRMVQAVFDDENPEPRDHWQYPDTDDSIHLNSASTIEGVLKPAYFDQLDRIIQRCDEPGMVVIFNYYVREIAKSFTVFEPKKLVLPGSFSILKK